MAVARGARAHDQARKRAEAERERQEAELIEQREAETRQANTMYEPVLRQIEERQQKHVERIKHKYPELRERREAQLARQLEEAKTRYEAQQAEIASQRQEEEHLARASFDRDTSQFRDRSAARWDELKGRWDAGTQRFREVLEELDEADHELFPRWDDQAWAQWHPPDFFPPAIRFGELEVDFERIEGGVPRSEELALPFPQRIAMPAVLAFPGHLLAAHRARGEGTAPAIETLQTIMLRLLTPLPPGKVRFTIIDPVGLGQNFAAFMHLADYDESLVTNRIWTEPRHIEQRLADLTEHMENVIQKYLRNEFETIEEYNAAGRRDRRAVPLPGHRQLPGELHRDRRPAPGQHRHQRPAVRRLHAARPSTPRQTCPQGFDLADLRRETRAPSRSGARAASFACGRDGLRSAAAAARIEPPPSDDLITRLPAQRRRRGAATPVRVEVPFACRRPAPPKSVVDRASCGERARRAAGRVRRRRSCRTCRLGRGTSQHVLIAGKTGSGKSTLLHALITNLALWYSPTRSSSTWSTSRRASSSRPTRRTAAAARPRGRHRERARVRPERAAAARRRTEAPRRSLPRPSACRTSPAIRRLAARTSRCRASLLIIDEFQEFFVEDDKVAQDAALLLDRLVRQGRAFGIHVLLGSQTLGGAYSLARSTIGQMAVRIALQCSEADAHLILSEDNTAARLLDPARRGDLQRRQRPVRGQQPVPGRLAFRTTSDERYLQANRGLGATTRASGPPIVFEGNVPADSGDNQPLEAWLQSRTSTTTPSGTAYAWLGEADRHQRSHRSHVPKADGQQLAARRTAGRAGGCDHEPWRRCQPRRAAKAPEDCFRVLSGLAPCAVPGIARSASRRCSGLRRRDRRREMPEIPQTLAGEVDRRQRQDGVFRQGRTGDLPGHPRISSASGISASTDD